MTWWSRACTSTRSAATAPARPNWTRRSCIAARIFVEHEPQTRIEGEIQHLPATHPVEALWRVVAGEAPGRTDDAEITLFDSVGFAIEDFVALAYLRDDVAGTRFAGDVDLITSPEDPKDLFSLVATPSLTPARR